MYDAIIVGGRCAGASVAMLLARRGFKVLMVDRDELPSDKKISTHLLWHAGAACLSRWDLLEKLEATNCPPLSDFVLDFGVMQLRGQVPDRGCGVDASYSPRRVVLDGLLLDEAKAAGVEVRDRCSVKELTYEGERVSGVRFTTADGETIEAQSKIVVGADGINSTVAKLVGAEEYNVKPKSQQSYFSYFSDVELSEVEFHGRPGRMGYAWNTNDGQVMAGFGARIDDCAKMNSDTETEFWNEMEQIAPALTEKLKAGRQMMPITSGATRSFIRPASGSGWALTGDAGMNMDPITAAGISNSFIQAEMLVELICAGLLSDTLDETVAGFGPKRDEAFGPLYEFTAEMAKLDPETPDEVMQMFGALVGNQKDTDAYFGVFAQTVPVMEFFDPANVQRIIEQGKAVA